MTQVGATHWHRVAILYQVLDLLEVCIDMGRVAVKVDLHRALVKDVREPIWAVLRLKCHERLGPIEEGRSSARVSRGADDDKDSGLIQLHVARSLLAFLLAFLLCFLLYFLLYFLLALSS